ncbi:hypothetical protein HMPREF0872_04415 [Veillonella montpellierensis DNF00314]|uniref:Uncharacterized protein n=1 Tax=Veillonella montpellierensis DNF00314 TaxID=1401067 RepID=A0A096ALA2_9FIRM|nr:hypothetical protein [Veillonella montpellierensis]KGF47421.1 hypothetical protein HMPREF0872_04415 [Veillonella montpellierensis DNF00314]
MYIVEGITFDGVFQYLPLPLDTYIFDVAVTHFGIETPNTPWNSGDEYEKQYVPYQNERMKHIHSVDPLRWAVRMWLQEVRNMK